MNLIERGLIIFVSLDYVGGQNVVRVFHCPCGSVDFYITIPSGCCYKIVIKFDNQSNGILSDIDYLRERRA